MLVKGATGSTIMMHHHYTSQVILAAGCGRLVFCHMSSPRTPNRMSSLNRKWILCHVTYPQGPRASWWQMRPKRNLWSGPKYAYCSQHLQNSDKVEITSNILQTRESIPTAQFTSRVVIYMYTTIHSKSSLELSTDKNHDALTKITRHLQIATMSIYRYHIVCLVTW